MKNSNHELNKALRKFLQHSLGNHAVAPKPAVDAAILKALQQKQLDQERSKQRRKRIGTAGLALLLVLFILPLTWTVMQRSTPFLNQENTITRKVIERSPARPEAMPNSSRSLSEQNVSSSSNDNTLTASRSARHAERSVVQTLEKLPENVTAKVSAKPHSIAVPARKSGQNERSAPERFASSHNQPQKIRVINNRSTYQTATLVTNKQSTPPVAPPVVINQGSSLPVAYVSSAQETLVGTTDSLLSDPAGELTLLNPIVLPTLTHLPIAPTFRTIQPLSRPYQANSRRQRTVIEETNGLHWLLNVVPLTTRQRVILLPNSEARVQDVRFSSQLNQSAGYKLTVGAEKKGFQVMLSYTQLQMRSTYAYSTDRYVVEENKNQYSIKRLGTPATTALSIQLAGVVVRKQLVINNPVLGRLFANVGLEYARSLESAPQQFLFASASVGKLIGLAQGTTLCIGPYVDYSFNKLQPVEQLQIRPYQAGLSFSIRLKQPTH